MWFVIGGVLLVLAPVIFLGALFTVLRPLTQEDAVFPADGQEHQVSVDAGEERALFSEDGQAVQCVATTGSGTDVQFRGVNGDFTFNEWQAVARFDTGGRRPHLHLRRRVGIRASSDRPAPVDRRRSSPGSWSV